MNDQGKTKAELIQELGVLRQRVAELEALQSADSPSARQGWPKDILPKQAEAERARFINQLRTATEVSNQLTAILDIEQLLYNVVTLLQSRFDLYHVHVYLLNETNEDLEMRVGSGEVGRQLRKQRHHIPLHSQQSLVARAARTGNIVAIDNVHQEAGFLANPLLPKTQVELAIPLIAGNKVLGVLDIQDNTPYRFTQSEIDVFCTLAAQIATALHNAHLFEERKRGEEILHHYATRLEALRRIDRDILTAQSPESIAQAALNHIRHMIPCRRASVVEFNLERHEVCLLAAFVDGQIRLRPGEILPPEPFNTEVLKQGRIHVIYDLCSLPEPTPLERAILEAGFRSYINVPLMVQAELIGSLNIGSDRPNNFTADHLDIAEEVAISLAIAIQQARLYEQAQQDAETKAILLHEVNHRVKNNLAAIVGLLYIEQQHTGMIEQPTYQSILTDLITRIEGLATVHQMLSASHWAPLRLSELARQIIQSVVQALAADRPILTGVTDSVPVYVSPKQANSLAMVINEMATNTIKYAITARQVISILLNIRVVEEDHPTANHKDIPEDHASIIILEYRDNGPGFPEEVLRGGRQNVGIYLIRNIVRRDLQGQVTLGNDNGAVILVQFKAMEAIRSQ
jgi:GAF domain-containing protein